MLRDCSEAHGFYCEALISYGGIRKATCLSLRTAQTRNSVARKDRATQALRGQASLEMVISLSLSGQSQPKQINKRSLITAEAATIISKKLSERSFFFPNFVDPAIRQDGAASEGLPDCHSLTSPGTSRASPLRHARTPALRNTPDKPVPPRDSIEDARTPRRPFH